MEFTIFPAIDLRNGLVVRLKKGNPHRQTTFSQNPLAVARQWQQAGAAWLHIVNLDGAFDQTGAVNWSLLPQLAQLDIHVQFGGGVRSLDDIKRVLDSGIKRVILGTAAVENPELVATALAQYGPEWIVIGIDARDGFVKTRGWQTDTDEMPIQLGLRMAGMGVKTIIFTDISRDGVLTGVNVSATADLAQQTGLQVIASGGVATIDDIRRCYNNRHQGVAGVIIGRAIYDGRIQLNEVFTMLRQADAAAANRRSA